MEFGRSRSQKWKVDKTKTEKQSISDVSGWLSYQYVYSSFAATHHSRSIALHFLLGDVRRQIFSNLDHVIRYE